jgi:hypothetical protein
MPSVTIDTCVLAAPLQSVSHDDIIEYVETLLDWKKLLGEPWVAIYMSEHAAEAMIDEGVYPLRAELKRLFQAKGIEEYDYNTVGILTEELLKKTPYFETYFRIQDVLSEEVSTLPDLLSIHTGQELASELARCVVMMAILHSSCRQPLLDHNLIVKPWQGSTVVQVKALIHDIDTTRDDLLALPVPPEFFSGEILTCQNFRELVLNLDEAAIWKAADNEIGLELATKITVYKSRLERAVEPDWDSIHGFRFGCEFYQRMRACEQGGSPGLVDRTLRSLAETIDKQKMRDVHEKRTGMGGGDPQETRGQDKAWRRDIDREYHLHYWECADGTIEFASVGPHNMFEIPKCS